MTVIDFLVLLAVAGVSGSIGQAIAGSNRGGCLVSIALGFIGAAIGLVVARNLHLPEFVKIQIGDEVFPLIWSILGAALFMIVVRLLTERRGPRGPI